MNPDPFPEEYLLEINQAIRNSEDLNYNLRKAYIPGRPNITESQIRKAVTLKSIKTTVLIADGTKILITW
jgi:hypothetical protein